MVFYVIKKKSAVRCEPTEKSLEKFTVGREFNGVRNRTRMPVLESLRPDVCFCFSSDKFKFLFLFVLERMQ